MSNYVRNFDVKNYQNQTTTPQLIANNMSGCFFLKHGVDSPAEWVVEMRVFIIACMAFNNFDDCFLAAVPGLLNDFTPGWQQPYLFFTVFRSNPQMFLFDHDA